MNAFTLITLKYDITNNPRPTSDITSKPVMLMSMAATKIDA